MPPLLLRPASLISRALLATGCALAASGSWAAPALSPEDVSVLAGACVNCHAPPGQGNGLMPIIHGRDEAFLRQRLMAFRTGSSDASATVMPRLLKAYNEVQIEALARWFSQQTVQEPKKAEVRR